MANPSGWHRDPRRLGGRRRLPVVQTIRIVASRVMIVVGLTTAITLGPAMACAEDTFAVIISGASGGPDYADTYARWRQGLVTALRTQDGFREDHLFVLAERPGGGAGLASKDVVTRTFATLRERMSEDSVLLVVLLGHGTFDDLDAKFNLVGPDLEAHEWDGLLDALPGRAVFVNTTAASFPFVSRLADDRRVVIAATSSMSQQYDTIFPEFFTAAFTGNEGDLDKDDRVSVWEAFTFASAEVRRWFQRRGRLATERAILDDTGDGRGLEADDVGGDGIIAERVFVGAGIATASLMDRSLMPLVRRRDGLVARVAELRSRHIESGASDNDTVGEYRRRLEALLVELARVSREIRRHDGG